MPNNSSSRSGRWIAALLVVAGLAALFYNVVVDNMPKGEVRKIENYTPWSEETIRAAETLPIQEGGRVKPLSTYAGFTMLELHGARSMKVEGKGGENIRLKPTEWLLDALFRPELAIQLPTFRVDNSAALEAIGVKPRGKRDRYSYSDIEPGRGKLFELARSYGSIDAKKREPVQTQIVDLASNFRSFERFLGYLSFARSGVVLRGTAKEGEADKRTRMSTLMEAAPELRKQLTPAHGQSVDPKLADLQQQIMNAASYAWGGPAILPPADSKETDWHDAGQAIMATLNGEAADPEVAISDIEKLEELVMASDESESEFRNQLMSLRDRLADRAATRGEYKHIVFEAEYYRKNWFLSALVFFILGTLSAFAMWGFGQSMAGMVFAWITFANTVVGLAFCVIAITQRCIIMERPPVGNLYDTIIFIASAVVALSLIVEWMVRRRFALGLGPILGALLIVLARRFELGDAKDHMDPLVAVLQSNFWLTIHVITITLGYSAGLLSAFLSTCYILLRGLGLDGGDQGLRRSVTRAVYGILCLTLFLSLVGTVLGGIWANYSWGRFWGWDPKENGALLIVIWTLAVLHARLGGFLREWWLHFASVFTAVVVAFSWWHVNFLGVGLHNYGFSAGKNTIWAFYSAMGAIIVFGMIAKALEASRKAAAK